ncbi:MULTISPECIES: dihydroorotase family protein [unclassified Leucobacter]|uniref:dihydroorotase n=1 Tax=unclassified Leucobacter TaxID=2621730 RepID=UPI00165E7005|nr:MULTISPECIES: amidohydrolase family protein [unclassified Leucobacter]MBC9936539.1 amidohydrolase family protein [Leucobacter sp. cx-87]
MSEPEFVVRGERVLIGGAFRPADVVVKAGRITRISALGSETASARLLDAQDGAVLPGLIDLHVHFDNPGDSISEDFRVGSANAALGGITCLVDHPFSTPLTVTAEALAAKIVDAEAGSHVDFGLWGGLTAPHLDELPGMMRAGVSGFKAFLPENDMGVVAARREHVRRGLEISRDRGGMVLVHAEDRVALLELDERARQAGLPRDYARFAAERGPEIELIAVREVLELVQETGGAAHFVHLSVPEAVDLVTAARAAGHSVTCEVAAHHLMLTAEDLRVQGWPALCAPPLREEQLVEGMWDRLRDGAIQAVVSDHCPYDPEEKAAADRDPFAGPFGIQGVKEFGPLFLSEAQARGWTLEDAAQLLTSGPAALCALGQTKGDIAVGADADFCILDTQTPTVVDVTTQVGDWRWTPYDGRSSSVSVRHTVVRGREVVRDGVLVGEPGLGQFQPMWGRDR